jgi:hypothetical protein
VTFTAGKAPGGSVTFDFTWHLLNSQTTTGGPITLTPGSSQGASTSQNTRSASGEVYVTWVADGVAGRSVPVSVNATCLT